MAKMEPTSDFCFLYCPFPDAESALAVARALIDAQLAACVNVYPPMTSVYMWEGKREESGEVAAFIKTRRALVEKAVALARPLHPYTTPCFMVIPITMGNEDYLTWACAQTKSE